MNHTAPNVCIHADQSNPFKAPAGSETSCEAMEVGMLIAEYLDSRPAKAQEQPCDLLVIGALRGHCNVAGFNQIASYL